MRKNVVRARTKGTAQRALLAAALALVGGLLTAEVRADLIQFNPNGTGTGAGDLTGISQFQYATADATAQGTGPVNVLTNGTTSGNFNLYYQTVLTAATGLSTGSASAPLYNFNGSGTEFTVDAGFTERISNTALSVGGGNASVGAGADGANVSLAAGTNLPGGFSTSTTAPNFFEIRAATPGSYNPSNGTGTVGTGPVILSGFITSVNGAFNENGTITGGTFTGGTVPLNQSGLPAGGTLDNLTPNTITGTGSTNIVVRVTFANTSYFPTPPTLFSLNFNSNVGLPFTQIPPTNQFFNGTAGFTSTYGTTNGTDTNLLLSAQANNGFTAVPEPSSIAMGLAALIGVPLLARLGRRRNKVSA